MVEIVRVSGGVPEGTNAAVEYSEFEGSNARRRLHKHTWHDALLLHPGTALLYFTLVPESVAALPHLPAAVLQN